MHMHIDTEDCDTNRHVDKKQIKEQGARAGDYKSTYYKAIDSLVTRIHRSESSSDHNDLSASGL